ncbi:Uncharacterized protein QTN25_008726 [Entamoeba marina]
MNDPRPSQQLIDHLLKYASDLQEKPQFSGIDLVKYFSYIFQNMDELKWVEFEYCVKFPLKLLTVETSDLPTVTYPRLKDSNKYQHFLTQLQENQRTQMTKKVSNIPLSISTQSLIKVGAEVLTDLSHWKIISEQLTVSELPTSVCDNFIRHLAEFSTIKTPLVLNTPVTLTQSLIDKRVDYKKEIWELFKQNSRKAQIGRAKNRSECQQDRSETVERSSDTPNIFDKLMSNDDYQKYDAFDRFNEDGYNKYDYTKRFSEHPPFPKRDDYREVKDCYLYGEGDSRLNFRKDFRSEIDTRQMPRDHVRSGHYNEPVIDSVNSQPSLSLLFN